MMGPTDAVRPLVERLDEAGLPTDRFIDVKNGSKRPRSTHQQMPPGDVSGNYGVYAGRGLVGVDVDEYDGDESLFDLLGLPETFVVKTPHSDGVAAGHAYYKVVTDRDPSDFDREVLLANLGEKTTEAVRDDAVALELTERLGQPNHSPSFGEVRVSNQYVVGPGSQLDGCAKDWCDECEKPDGGRYEIANDVPIATITVDDLVETVEEHTPADDNDVRLGDGGEAAEGEAPPAAATPSVSPTPSSESLDGVDTDRLLGYARDRDEKLKELLDESNPDDRSEYDLVLAGKLAFWLQGDERVVEQYLDRFGSEKWQARGDAYRDDKLEAVRKKSDFADLTKFKIRCAEEDGVFDGVAGSDDEAAEQYTSIGEWYERVDAWIRARTDEQNQPPSTREIRRFVADELRREERFIMMRRRTIEQPSVDARELYRFDPGCGYYTEARGWVGDELAKVTQIALDDRDEAKVIYHLKADPSRESVYDNDDVHGALHPDGLINVANGVLDPETRELHDHSPEWLFTDQIPWDYDPDAECENIETLILDRVVNTEADRKTLEELAGWALNPRYEPEGWALLTGEGGNGKGRYLDLLDTLYGGTTSKVPISDFVGDNRFALRHLEGAIANFDTDTGADYINNADAADLKKAAVGEELAAEKKHAARWMFENRAKLFFAMNELPRFEQIGSEISRRFYWMELPNYFGTEQECEHPDTVEKFYPKMEKEDLKELVETDEEMSGLLNLALDGLDRLKENGDFTNMKGYAEYELRADPVKHFVDTCLEHTADRGHVIEKRDLTDAYNAFAEAEGHELKNTATLMKALKNGAMPQVDDEQIYLNGGERRPRAVRGVWFTDEGVGYLDDQTRANITETYNGMGSVDNRPIETPPFATLEGVGDIEGEVTPTDDGGTVATTEYRTAGLDGFDFEAGGSANVRVRTKTVTNRRADAGYFDEEGVFEGEDGTRVKYLVRSVDQTDERVAFEQGEWYEIADAEIAAYVDALVITPGLAEVSHIEISEYDHTIDDYDDDGDGADGGGDRAADALDALEAAGMNVDRAATESGEDAESASPAAHGRGEASGSEPHEATTDGSGTSQAALVDRIRDELLRGPKTRGELCGALAGGGADPETIAHRLEKMREQGDVIEDDGQFELNR